MCSRASTAAPPRVAVRLMGATAAAHPSHRTGSLAFRASPNVSATTIRRGNLAPAHLTHTSRSLCVVAAEGGGRGKGWGRGKGEAVEVVLRCHTAVLAMGPARVSARDRVRASRHVPVLAIRSDDALGEEEAAVRTALRALYDCVPDE